VRGAYANELFARQNKKIVICYMQLEQFEPEVWFNFVMLSYLFFYLWNGNSFYSIRLIILAVSSTRHTAQRC